MSDITSIYQGIPSPLKIISERPFGAKGMVLNAPPQMVPEGAILTGKNCIATEGGAKRRPGRGLFTSSLITLDPPIQDVMGFWKATGDQELLVMGQDYLYKVIPSTGYITLYDQWDIGGRITGVGTTAITGQFTRFISAGVLAGDLLIIDADATAGGPYYRTIMSISLETGAGAITVDTLVTVGTCPADTDFRIGRPLRNTNPIFPDWTVTTGGLPKFIIADGVNPLRAYDGATLGNYGDITTGTITVGAGSGSVTGISTNFILEGAAVGNLFIAGTTTTSEASIITVVALGVGAAALTVSPVINAAHTGTVYKIVKIKASTFIPTCIAFHKDRLWAANTNEGTNIQYRQRIRWSQIGDVDNFVMGGYLDLPYTQGAVKKLVPLGDFLIAYFDDAIFIGRPTNNPALPLSFQRIETGGIGLLGMKAVTPFFDSHFFVGQDNIYALSATKGLTPIGNNIVSKTVKEVSSSRHWFIQVAIDFPSDRVVFGFPKSGSQIEQLWSYSYKTGGWTYDDVNCDSLSSNSFSIAKTWQNWVTAAVENGVGAGGTGVTGVLGDATLEGIGAPVWTVGQVANGDSVLISTLGDGNYDFVTTVSSRTDNDTLEMVDTAPSDFTNKPYRIVKASATWEGTEMQAYPSWESVRGSSTTVRDLYIGIYDALWKYEVGSLDDNGSQVIFVVETGDKDFNTPGEEKFFGKLSIKLETWNSLVTPMTFTVEGSTDRGQHWKNLGVLTIRPNTDEGSVNFRLRGDMARFKLTSTSATPIFTLNEILVKSRLMGNDVAARGDT